jgi:hypothetical protein
MFAGIVAIAIGVVAAVAIWFVAESRRDDAIAGLARAPVGCDTTLDFAEPGTYLVFVETMGDVGDVRGDCGVEGAFSVDDPPALAVEIVDPDGEQVEAVDRDGDITYDGSGSSGRSRYEIEITTAGDHVMRVEASESAGDFVLAVGRDPGRGVGALRLLAGAVALLGIGSGIVLLTRSRPPSAVPGGPGTVTAWSGPASAGAPAGPLGPLGPPPGGPPLGPPNAPPASGAPVAPPPGSVPSPWGAPPAPPSDAPSDAPPPPPPTGAATAPAEPRSAPRSPWAAPGAEPPADDADDRPPS